jgi:hypothetical protein
MSQSLKSPLFGVLVALVVVLGFSLTTIQVASSQVPTEPPSFPDDGTVATERLGGETRFETSVAISQEAFPAGAEDVFLARADLFPDALSAGSLTTGPILLVPSCGEVPQVVLDEIARLAPSRVVALGGVDAVCDDVVAQAQEAAQGGDGSETPSPSPDPTASETNVPSPSPSPSETNPECSGIPILDPCPTETPTPTHTPAP